MVGINRSIPIEPLNSVELHRVLRLNDMLAWMARSDIEPGTWSNTAFSSIRKGSKSSHTMNKWYKNFLKSGEEGGRKGKVRDDTRDVTANIARRNRKLVQLYGKDVNRCNFLRAFKQFIINQEAMNNDTNDNESRRKEIRQKIMCIPKDIFHKLFEAWEEIVKDKNSKIAICLRDGFEPGETQYRYDLIGRYNLKPKPKITTKLIIIAIDIHPSLKYEDLVKEISNEHIIETSDGISRRLQLVVGPGSFARPACEKCCTHVALGNKDPLGYIEAEDYNDKLEGVLCLLGAKGIIEHQCQGPKHELYRELPEDSPSLYDTLGIGDNVLLADSIDRSNNTTKLDKPVSADHNHGTNSIAAVNGKSEPRQVGQIPINLKTAPTSSRAGIASSSSPESPPLDDRRASSPDQDNEEGITIDNANSSLRDLPLQTASNTSLSTYWREPSIHSSEEDSPCPSPQTTSRLLLLNIDGDGTSRDTPQSESIPDFTPTETPTLVDPFSSTEKGKRKNNDDDNSDYAEDSPIEDLAQDLQKDTHLSKKRRKTNTSTIAISVDGSDTAASSNQAVSRSTNRDTQNDDDRFLKLQSQLLAEQKKHTEMMKDYSQKHSEILESISTINQASIESSVNKGVAACLRGLTSHLTLENKYKSEIEILRKENLQLKEELRSPLNKYEVENRLLQTKISILEKKLASVLEGEDQHVEWEALYTEHIKDLEGKISRQGGSNLKEH